MENELIQAGACLDHVSLCLFSDSLGNHDTLDGLPSVTGSWLSGSVPYHTTSESASSLGVYSRHSGQHCEACLGESDCFNLLYYLLEKLFWGEKNQCFSLYPVMSKTLEGNGGEL